MTITRLSRVIAACLRLSRRAPARTRQHRSMLSHRPVSAGNNLPTRSFLREGHAKRQLKSRPQGFLETVFACVLAAFLKMAANVLRVIGCIFFRVSSRGSKFSCLRFIDLLYHARRTLRIAKTELVTSFHRAFAANRWLQAR